MDDYRDTLKAFAVVVVAFVAVVVIAALLLGAFR